MTQLEQFTAMLTASGTLFSRGQLADTVDVTTRHHLRDGSLNFVETTYRFVSGYLKDVLVEVWGCPICCETGDEGACCDANLLLAEAEQEKIVEDYNRGEV